MAYWMILAASRTGRIPALTALRMINALAIGMIAFGLIGCGQEPPTAAGNGDTPARIVTEADVQTALDAVNEHVQGDRLSEAAVILDTLVERVPDHPEVRRARGDVLFRLADNAGKGMDASQVARLRQMAADEYKAAAEADPENASLQHAAGVMHMTAGDSEDALAFFMRAASLDSTQPQYPLFAAQILIQQGDLVRAETYVQAALSVDKELPHAWASLAIIEMERGEYDDAMVTIAKARELAPRDLGLRAQHARILRRAGNPQEAIELLSAVAQAEGDGGAIAQELALSHIALGELDRGANIWDTAVARDLQLLRMAPVPLALARAYYDAGDRRTAMRWLQRCRQSDLSDSQVSEMRNLEVALRSG